MSPRELPPPQSSRIAVVVYVLCGAIGTAGLFAAVNDVTAHDEVVEVTVVEARDARLAVGVWRGPAAEGGNVVVLDAAGHGSRCIGGAPSTFKWHLEGDDVRDDAGNVLGTLSSNSVGQTLQVGQLVLVQTGGGAL